MFQVYKDSKLFYNLSFVFVLVGAIILISTTKGDVEIWANQFHSPSLNIFFYWITYLGDGFVSVLFIVALFFRRIYWGILSAISFLATALVTQFLKRIVFEGFPRPSRFFDPTLIPLKYVEGLEIHGYFSFPSGHSSGVFSIFLLISLISKRPLVQVFCFFIAFATAVSRIYLLQHFFMDIYAGTILGIVVTSFSYYSIEYRSKLSTIDRLQQPLIGRIKK